MKHMALHTTLFCILVLVTGWSAEQSTGNHARKQKTNFRGVLTTSSGQRQGIKTEIENISIAGLIDNIIFFEVPEKTEGKLKTDPRKGAKSFIDLKDITRIDVPNPEKVWNYKRSESSEGVDYIEIFITPRGGTQKKNYIIERNKMLHYDEETTGKPFSTQRPFHEIQSLVLLSCSERCNPTQEETQDDVCQTCPRP